MCGRFTLFDKTSFDFEMGIDFKPNFNVFLVQWFI